MSGCTKSVTLSAFNFTSCWHAELALKHNRQVQRDKDTSIAESEKAFFVQWCMSKEYAEHVAAWYMSKKYAEQVAKEI